MSSAWARVIREVVRTPAFREIIRLNLMDIEPQAARETVRTLLAEDAELSLGLAASSPQAINYMVEALLELGRQVRRYPTKMREEYLGQVLDEIDQDRLQEIPRVWMPLLLPLLPGLIHAKASALRNLAEAWNELAPEEREEQLRQALSSLDGEAWGRAITAMADGLARLRAEQPDLINHARPAVEAAVRATDFGKLREGVTALADFGADLAESAIEPALKNPVVMSNLVFTFAPLLNAWIRVLADLLNGVELPPEITASGLFNLMTDVDKKELGRLVNGATRLVNELHEGNLILGREEPRFRSVFTDFSEALLNGVDQKQAARAAVALSEDLEVVAAVIAELLHQDPELLTLTASVEVAIYNAMVRSVAQFLQQAIRISDDTLRRVSEEVENNVDVKEVARAFNLALVLSNRCAEVNPELVRKWFEIMVSNVDREKLAKIMAKTGGDLLWAVRENAELQKAWAPEEVGQRINRMLARFNERMTAQEGAGEYLKRLFAAVDAKELELAVRNLLDGLLNALLATTSRGMAVIRPMFSAGWRVVRFLLGALKQKVLGRKQEESK